MDTMDDPRPAGSAFWSLDATALARQLHSGPEGLTTADAADRLGVYGPNLLREQTVVTRLDVLIRQVRSPLLLLLLFAALASAATSQWIDATIVLTIVAATVAIGYVREYHAESAAAALRARLSVRATAMRDGRATPVDPTTIVPGDVVLLAAGSLVPADGVILDATDFFVSEAVLTGESFPSQKSAGVVDADAELGERTNCVFLGSNVRSGTARCLIVHTGPATEFGAIAHHLAMKAPDTEFDRGVRRFGYLLTSAMLIMVLLVFVAHMLRGRPPVETLLFSIALAVGLSPELLPAILGVNLARSAERMAERGVLVRRLNAIENLGSMDVLCTDKTGTLTEGKIKLEGAYGATGEPSPAVLELGAWNAALETGVTSPLDEAITDALTPTAADTTKIAEVPFDFVRKRVTIVVQRPDGTQMIVKGAYESVLAACSRLADGTPLEAAQRRKLDALYEQWTGAGIRVLAVAERQVDHQASYAREDERDLTFAGFLTFFDRPRADVAETLKHLAALGVRVTLITGDSSLVARHVAASVGMSTESVVTGRELAAMRDEALSAVAERTDLFVEVDPNQKERIIRALRRRRHVVGFLGDGVNDAPAMHAADTSLSVESAVDVARQAADFVLLEQGLDVIRRGIEDGRTTFANTLKYVQMTTSANLGNMVSMAIASLFLPFLPLTAGQILLNNFLSDVPALGIAGDNVDPELVDSPRRWDMRFIGRYMLEFGLMSSAFDLLTFAALLFVFKAAPEEFRTGWFIESLLTELTVALIVRTRRPFFRSVPGSFLLASTIALALLTLTIPYLPGASIFGFVPLPASLLAAVAGITLLYTAATELQKRWFYRTPRR